MIHDIIDTLDKHAGAVQALSAVIVAILTGFLVIYTRKYVKETADSLTVARDQLTVLRRQIADQEAAATLARQQFEQEWTPDLRIADVRMVSPETEFRFANLGRSAALVKETKIGTGGVKGIEPQDVVSYQLCCLVKAGEILTNVDIARQLRTYGIQHLPAGNQTGVWQVATSIALVYDCAGGTAITSDWFHCNVVFSYRRDVTGTTIQVTTISER